MFNYSENIYSDDFFKAYKLDNSIVVELKQDNNLIISSWHNGGYNENMTHVVNQMLEGDDYLNFREGFFDDFHKEKIASLGLNPNTATGITTSACMDNYAISTSCYEKLKVTSIVTAGADKNAVKAGDSASFYEYNNHYMNHFGTINIITIINANLNPGSLVTAGITMTEAKTSVLNDLKLESKFSSGIATGTGTDGLCVISNRSSSNHIENAGKHSKLGELIALSVRRAVYDALYLETGMCTEYQKSVLNRLSRFNVTFEDFFNDSSVDNLLEYATLFNDFNSDSSNIAFVSSLINLVDEVQTGLLTINEVEPVFKNMLCSYFSFKKSVKMENIGDMMGLLVEAINYSLLH